jgi:hypothetical protein
MRNPGRPSVELVRISAMLTGEMIHSDEPVRARKSSTLSPTNSSARAASPRIQ